MKITILCVGKIKENYFNGAVSEYMKRLSRYCKPEIIEVADEKTPDGAGEALNEQIKQKEAERLFKYIPDSAFVVVLAIKGKQLTSEELASKIENIGINGKDHIVFIIGGSLGTAPEIDKRADLLLSFSKMTFPHQLMRVVLLEQIYRSYRIISGEPYHK
ncbi:MAG: 23S rRNA (pseudouridine(1915)-N(3))-methyltransferase RlmH [Lachnospiraceae bacterium]|nr:23S rRNA (pseudouridine(1915)-N(3))-methyltransferase RlmH [Lachnospiraceae bacterium]